MKPNRKPSMHKKVIERRKRVITRLEAQLKSGVKNTKEGSIALSEKDVNRINNQISILRARV